MRVLAIAIALAVTACGQSSGSALSPGSSTPAPTATASPSAAASNVRLPASSVRVSVNGVDYRSDQEMRGPASGPLDIVMRFPVDMDRASVERFVPAGTAIDWTDGRTLQLVIPESSSSHAFKIADARSVDGSATFDLIVVNITLAATRTIRVYTVADLKADRRPRPSSAWRVSADGVSLSPDATRAFVYDAGPYSPEVGPAPAMVDLATRASVAVAIPASDGWFAYADWIGDRLVVVGNSVWTGDARGNGMRKIADATTAAGGRVWVVVPDPAGQRLALWAYNADGHVAIVDLADGTVRLVSGPFRRCAADGAVSLAWSKDGTLLAGVDCDSENGPDGSRVRIVDLATGRTARTIDGPLYALQGFPTGELVVVRDSGERGAGARESGVVTTFAGVEVRRYLGVGWSMSPDGRYILQSEPSQGMASYTLIEVASDARTEFALDGGITRWLPDGRLVLYTRNY